MLKRFWQRVARPISTDELDRSQERTSIGILIATPVWLVILALFT